MQKTIQNLILFSFILVALPACDRAAENSTTKLTVQLPGMISANLSPLATTDSFDEEENFLNIIPTGVQSGSRQINCYLIGVRGLEDSMSKNYCGQKNASGVVASTYLFGTYLGLRPAGSTLTLDVPPGDGRRVLVFGLYGVSAAACIDMSEKPKKINFSHMYYLGSSALMKYEAGAEITVPVNISLDLNDDLKRIDDCIIDEDQRPQAQIANSIKINTNRFPYNTLTKGDGGAHLYRCEALQVDLVNTLSTESLAIWPSDLKLEIRSTGNILRNVYSSAAECNSAANPTPDFTIPAGQKNIIVWTRFTATDPNAIGLVINALNATLTHTTQNFILTSSPGQEYVFAPALPLKMTQGECYAFDSSYITASGNVIDASVLPSLGINYYSMTATSTHSPSVGTFFSDTTCTNAMGDSDQIAAGSSGVSRSFKLSHTLDSAIKFINFSFISVAPTVHVVHPAKVVVQIDRTPDAANILSSIRFLGKSHIVKPTTFDICVPLNFQALDQYKRLYKPTVLETFSIDNSSTDMTNIVIYAEHTCTFTISPTPVFNDSKPGTQQLYAELTTISTVGEARFTVKMGGVRETFRFQIANH